MKTSLLSLFSLVLLIFVSCNNSGKNSTSSAVNATPIVAIVDTMPDVPCPIAKDSIHDQIAQLLGGYHTMDIITTAAGKKSYADYAAQVNFNWDSIKVSRLDKIDKWSASYLSTKIDDKKLLFYPFSGPDFLHAYHLFPNASNYLMLALERIGDLPNFKNTDETKLLNYLGACQYFIRDIYKRSYFITGSMDKDIAKRQVTGVLPIFYLFLARTGHEILDVEYVTLNKKGLLVPYSTDTMSKVGKYVKGVRFYFRKNKKSHYKELVYFGCDISDAAMPAIPEMTTYLKSIPPHNTFVKSASYLMSYGTFSKIRNIVLEGSNSIFQDDTGVAYRYFDKTKWDFNYFGKYTIPIADFSRNLFQKDLDKAYTDNSAQVMQLEFSLGYHWQSKEQNQILAIKK